MGQHAITSLLGVDLDSASSTEVFCRGTRVNAVDDTTNNYSADYIYVSADAAITQYDVVKIDDDFDCTPLTTAISGSEPTRVGAAQIAFSDTELGWVAVKGSFSLSALANCAADVKLYTTTTAGYLDDTATDCVQGVKLDTAIGGSNATGSAFAAIDMCTNSQD